MVVRLEIPMLSVDAGKMRNVDPRNAGNLYGMWSVFSKCADTVEDGRRLENLSWRIWARETLCCETQPKLATTPAIGDSRPRPKKKDVPALSSSVESEDSDEPEDEPNRSPRAQLNMKSSSPKTSYPLFSVSRGKEKHITPWGLEKMVASIQDKQSLEPLSPTLAGAIPALLPSTDTTSKPASPTMQAPFRSSDSSSSTAPISSPESDKSATQTVGSDTSAECHNSHSIVRGFSPNKVSSSYRSHTHLAPAIPTKIIIPTRPKDAKKGATFMLGGGSSDENDGSFESRMSSPAKQSTLTAGLKRPLNNKKQLSFKDEVESRTRLNKPIEDEGVFESDEEEEEEEDSEDNAIEEDSEEEDDDASEWEDDASENTDNPKESLFHRVDSKPNLVSRRSLLTTLLNQDDRAADFANMASKSTPALRRSRTLTPMAPSTGTSPQEDPSVSMLGQHTTPSKPIVMNRSQSHHQMALSPRTTRKNMLHSEMTESLRKSVLWERQQKRSTAQAVLKRSKTAQALTNLEPPAGAKGEHGDDWYADGLGAYHTKGW